MIDTVTIMTSLEAALKQLVEDEGGTLSVCGTVQDTLEVLTVEPRGWRLVLQLNGDEAITGGYGSAALVELLAIVQARKGLALPRGVSQHGGNTQLGFLHRLDWVRQRLSGVRFFHDAPGQPPVTVASLPFRPSLTYRGWQWLEIDGYPTLQASLRFSFPFGLPTPVDTPVLLPADPDC